MAFARRGFVQNGNFYRTTFLVANGDRHTHFSLGPRLEHGVRDVVVDSHANSHCEDEQIFYYYGSPSLDSRTFSDLPLLGLPIEAVDDWTEVEAEMLSNRLCPESREQYQEREMLKAGIEERVRQLMMSGTSGWGDEEIYTAPSNVLNEDFPLEFEDESVCPVCLEEQYADGNYLLRLPCAHTLCKCCYTTLGSSAKCPKCRKDVDRSLVKRKRS